MELRSEIAYSDKLKDTYYGFPEYAPVGSPYLYIVFKEHDDDLDRKIRKQEAYFDKVIAGDNVVYVMKITYDDIEKVVKPIMSGKYSEADREYVDRNFPVLGRTGEPQTVGLILRKDKSLREYWKQRIGQELPKGAEV